MKLYGCPNTRSLRAMWALEEAATNYEYIIGAPREGGPYGVAAERAKEARSERRIASDPMCLSTRARL